MRESPSIPLVARWSGAARRCWPTIPRPTRAPARLCRHRQVREGPVRRHRRGGGSVVVTEWLVYRNPDFRPHEAGAAPAPGHRRRNLYEPGRCAPWASSTTASGGFAVRVLITGAAGFLARTSRSLHRREHDVIAWTTSSPAGRTTSPHLMGHPRFGSSSTTSPTISTSRGRSMACCHFASPPVRSTISSCDPDAQGRIPRDHKALDSPRQRPPAFCCLDLGGIRRPPGASAAGELLGPREPGGPRASTTRPSGSPRP